MREFLTGAAYNAMRIVFAFMYVSHGLGWLFGMFGTEPAQFGSRFFSAGVIEMICGTLILLGLFTTPAAFIASGEMAVAYWWLHVPRGSVFPIENGGEITVALCFGLLYIAAHGGGALSVDQLRGSTRGQT